LIFIGLFIATLAFADSNQALIEMANKQYSDGDYPAAIANFEKVLETGYESAGLFYNLGNAYYKSGELSAAILFYEKAKLLAPNNEDINFNLELANSHVTDKLEIIPEFFLVEWINSFSLMFSTNQWAIAGMIALGLCLIFFLIFLYNRVALIRRFSFYLSMLLLVATISSFIFSSKEAKKLSIRDTAIIFSPSVTVKSSPDESGTDLFLLHEGSKVRLIDSIGTWVEISLSDGNEGWIEKEAIRVI
ncbi:MAG: tetratricopeptide repeat protein, partial [Bacteroidota bacterium]|nr:tetratricopeptide repeat protein [Bacteroidota bacterium]